MRYRKSNVPSLIQGDVPDDENQWCFKCHRTIKCDFHHLLNKTEKKFSETSGCWVWLCRGCHRFIHDTAEGQRIWKRWKSQAQAEYEKTHSREEWMKHAHKNYED